MCTYENKKPNKRVIYLVNCSRRFLNTYSEGPKSVRIHMCDGFRVTCLCTSIRLQSGARNTYLHFTGGPRAASEQFVRAFTWCVDMGGGAQASLIAMLAHTFALCIYSRMLHCSCVSNFRFSSYCGTASTWPRPPETRPPPVLPRGSKTCSLDGVQSNKPRSLGKYARCGYRCRRTQSRLWCR